MASAAAVQKEEICLALPPLLFCNLMSHYEDVNPRFQQRAEAEPTLPKVEILKLHDRPMQLLTAAEAAGLLAHVVDAVAILQVGYKLFSGSNPVWRNHHHPGLRSDLAAYSEVLRYARAGWKSDWIKNNGLNPTLYQEANAVKAQIERAYKLAPVNQHATADKLNQLYTLPFSDYHFKLVTFESTNSSNTRAIYHSTRVDHSQEEVRFVPSSRSIFSGGVRSENPPKFICGVPREMEHPPKNDAKYFELFFCTAVDQNGLAQSEGKARRGLDALAGLLTPE